MVDEKTLAFCQAGRGSLEVIKVFLLILFILAEGLNANAQQEENSLGQLQRYIEIAEIKLNKETERDSIFYYLKKSEKLALHLEADSLLAEVRSALAFWYVSKNDVKQAGKYLEENLRYATSVKDSFLLMRCYFLLGTLYVYPLESEQNDFASLLGHLLKAHEIAASNRDTLHLLLINLDLALAYTYLPANGEKALNKLREALSLTTFSSESLNFRALCHLRLGEYFLKNKDFINAIPHLEKSVEYGTNSESYGWLMNANQILSAAYEQIGNFKGALFSYKEYQAYYEELKDQQTQERAQQLEAEFDTKRKQEQISDLIHANQKQLAVIFAVILLVAIIIFLAIVALVNYRKRLSANQSLLLAQEESNRIQRRFFANISHEFRTPLTVISGMAGKLPDEEPKAAIQRNSEQLLQLVNQVLDLSKLEAGKLQLHFVQADIISYLSYLYKSFHSLAQKKNIDLSFQSDRETLFMDFDREVMKHILNNLLGNALKFTPERGKVNVSLKTAENSLIIQVKDSGQGIEPKELERIFERFYQGENQDTIGGTGIGLSFVKELVELIGGDIKVESQKGLGATFQLLLPIKNEAPFLKETIDELDAFSPIVQKTFSVPSWMKNSKQVNILILEDHPEVSDYIQKCLPLEFKVQLAFDGISGVEKAIAEVPDIIITDVMMPGRNGYEVCRILKNNRVTSHIPIIMLTARADESEKLEGLQQGADAYLIKPFNEQELNVRIQNLLQNIRRWQEKYAVNLDVSPNQRDSESHFLNQAQQLVLAHLSDSDYTIEQFCKDLAVSRTQLHRKLKSLTNLSATQFVNEIRLEKARQLLQEGGRSVSEVAYATGFRYPNYFAKVYKQKYGVSPGEAL
jgi:signal transduction histidine kinase/DNA-binding response OmpR family regulator